MGYIAPARGVVFDALAAAMEPPPPPDVHRWARDWLRFDESSPMPGRYDAARFPFFDRMFACVSPEHPAREVTWMGSAQIAKTETFVQATLGAWFDLNPRNALVVHPTQTSAAEWVRSKWMRMRRANERLRAIFGTGGNGPLDSLFYQETLDRTASLRTVSAGSPSELSGTTRPLVLMDDLAKFESSDQGDPEQLAISRASAFEDAKIIRTSTPLIWGACRISTAYYRGTAEQWWVPCPHCDHRQPLLWENALPHLDEANPERFAFQCVACANLIENRHREDIVAAGEWVATNPNGDHPSFWLWRAYMPFRSWSSISVEWFAAKGDPGREQTFTNDVLGLAYRQATEAPEWTELRDRVENAAPEARVPKGRIPEGFPILVCGVDCQIDRLEYQVVAFGRNYRAHTVEYDVIPHHIGEDEAQRALDALLERRWPNAAGRTVALDRLGIDGGTYTDDVWAWAKRHPWSRVIITKGSSSGVGPIYQPQQFERRKDGKARRAQKRAFLVNVSALKATFYADLRKADPDERGFQSFAVGLGDAFFRGLASERRVLKRNRFGVMESAWVKIEASGRNEPLDTRIIADVAARLEGSRTWGDAEWDAAEKAREAPPEVAPPADTATAADKFAALAGRPAADPGTARDKFARLAKGS